MTFSKTDKIFNKITGKILKIFPHIENLSVFYMNEFGVQSLINNTCQDVTSFYSTRINELRSSNLNYQWLLPNEYDGISFIEKNNFHQLDLLDEHENRLLVLNFKSKLDGLKDIICITFPKEITFLGMYKTVKNLTTDDKILIGELMFKICQVEMDNEILNLEIQSKLVNYIELKTNQKTNQQDTSFKIYLKNELKFYLNREKDLKIKLDFDDDLIYYILHNNIPIRDVVLALSESFEVVSIVENVTSEFKFELIHLQLTYESKVKQIDQSNELSDTKDKIIEILDKLEAAAQKIDKEGIVINGKTVAQNMQPPVSPPAVTDIIKKNITKIEVKMNEYPFKWSLIRKYLKPLRELEFKNQLLYNKKIG
jgi:hypothetical protein